MMTSTATKSPAQDDRQAQTEVLDKTPPHGTKGALPPSEGLSAQVIFSIAGTILLIAFIVTALMMIVSWWRERARRKSVAGEIFYNPNVWAELRKTIDRIVVPSGQISDSSSGSSTEVSQEQWNQFSSEVSLCLRRGLEIRTGLPLAESTTEEIMSMLTRGRFHLVVLSDHELRVTLVRLDRIRFGGVPMKHDEAAEILRSLKSWCEKLEADDKMRVPGSHENAVSVDSKGGLRVFNS